MPAAHPVSYKDPVYDALDAAVSSRLGLPAGLLSAIRLKGERTNADKVSEKGARTVYQIVPATRNLALKEYGIDPYLSPENAAEVAGRLLKDSLDRNKGDAAAAVREYHGGTDPKNWGPRTRAYVGRVTGGQSVGTSTFDRIKARREAQSEPSSIANIYAAYRAGQMTPQEAAEFEADVNGGAIMLPRGASLRQGGPKATVLPAGVVEAYNSHSEMSEAERDQLDADVAEGIVALPPGAKLQRPAPRSVGENLGIGVRGVMEAAGNAADFVGTPIRAPINAAAEALTGEPLIPTVTETTVDPLADTLGLQQPGTPAEKLVSAVGKGGLEAAMLGGLGGPVAGADGAVGTVGKALAEAPVKNIASGMGAGAGQETARQQGAGPLGQLAAGLAGGFGGYGSAAALERGAARFGTKVAGQVARHPEEVVFDEQGRLTEDGREVAARAGVEERELKAAYDEAKAPVEEAPQGSPAAALADEAAPAPVSGLAAQADALPASAAQRVEQAASEGVQLTKGEATKDFAAQDAEQTLLANPSAAGDKARAFKEQQQQQIGEAAERFRQGFGSTEANAAERGEIVQQAVAELRDQGRAGVSRLYEVAREIAAKAGEDNANLVNLDTAPILAKLRELFIDESVPEPVRKTLKQQAAKYGLIGEAPKTIEGETTVTLRDSTGQPGGKVTFIGPQERLTISNAETLRQRINQLYDPLGGRGNPQEGLKPLIDDAVEGALKRAAREGVGEVGQAFKAARQAHVEQKRTFEGKDIVQRLAAWKRGGKDEFQMNPEQVIKSIFGSGKEAVTNLKKVKAVLLNKPTEQSRAAWKAIQAHGVADIFDHALSPRGEISGARLDAAMKKFGDDKLKILLDPADYNQLQKLRRIIKDATVPLPNTTNPSGSGYKVIAYLAQQAAKLTGVARYVPGVGPIADAGIALAKNAHAAGQAEKTLAGMREFSPEKAPKTNVVALRGAEFARQFVDAAKSDAVLKSVLAAGEGAGEHQ